MAHVTRTEIAKEAHWVAQHLNGPDDAIQLADALLLIVLAHHGQNGGGFEKCMLELEIFEIQWRVVHRCCQPRDALHTTKNC